MIWEKAFQFYDLGKSITKIFLILRYFFQKYKIEMLFTSDKLSNNEQSNNEQSNNEQSNNEQSNVAKFYEHQWDPVTRCIRATFQHIQTRCIR